MKTILQLGPGDHGRAVSSEDLQLAQYKEGFQYELIEGKLYVSPSPNFPHEWLCGWLADQIRDYAKAHRDILQYVSTRPRVFLPGHDEQTAPEPDLAAYDVFPHHIPWREQDWRTISPLLVAEVVSEDDPDKDLVRNVELYRQVPSIREYWIFDPRSESAGLEMLIYRRRGQRWQKAIVVNEGETYTPRILPGFSLILDPSRT